MDESRAYELVDEATAPMMRSLHVGEWNVNVHVCEIENLANKASCEINAPYMEARIEIDPARHEGDREFLVSLRHELLHVALGEYTVYANAVLSHLPEEAQEVEDRTWTLASERTIVKLERMLDGLGKTPEVLAGMGEEINK